MTVMAEANNVSKSYGKNKILHNVSFSVKKGEILGILGPNGAGKTTILEILGGLCCYDEGSVSIGGIDVAKHSNLARYMVGVQPQSPSFEDKTKLKELIDFFAATYGIKVDARDILTKVELLDKADSYPEQLSGGQLQRFSFIVALIHRPKVLLLDEPTAGLDTFARKHFWKMIREIRSEGVTILLATHYIEEAEALCDRVMVLDEGRVVAFDTPKKLVRKLIKTGTNKRQKPEQSSLEDVFVSLTGRTVNDK